MKKLRAILAITLISTACSAYANPSQNSSLHLPHSEALPIGMIEQNNYFEATQLGNPHDLTASIGYIKDLNDGEMANKYSIGFIYTNSKKTALGGNINVDMEDLGLQGAGFLGTTFGNNIKLVLDYNFSIDPDYTINNSSGSKAKHHVIGNGDGHLGLMLGYTFTSSNTKSIFMPYVAVENDSNLNSILTLSPEDIDSTKKIWNDNFKDQSSWTILYNILSDKKKVNALTNNITSIIDNVTNNSYAIFSNITYLGGGIQYSFTSSNNLRFALNAKSLYAASGKLELIGDQAQNFRYADELSIDSLTLLQRSKADFSANLAYKLTDSFTISGNYLATMHFDNHNKLDYNHGFGLTFKYELL